MITTTPLRQGHSIRWRQRRDLRVTARKRSWPAVSHICNLITCRHRTHHLLTTALDSSAKRLEHMYLPDLRRLQRFTCAKAEDIEELARPSASVDFGEWKENQPCC